ncbi:MAG: hypothetical protein AAGJ83_05055, partial [Planctomycetota bacterium]
SDGKFNVGYDHGFAEGDTVVYTAGGDTSIEGLAEGGRYVVDRVDAQNIRLARTALEAADDPSTYFDPATDVSDYRIDLGYAHGFQTGDAVKYSPGTGSPLEFVTDLGVFESDDATTFFVIVNDDGTISLTEDLASTQKIGALHFLPWLHIADADEDGTEETIFFGGAHVFSTGDPVVYDSGGGTPTSNLVDGRTYWVVVEDEFGVRLADSESDALADTPITLELDATTGLGRNHSLQWGFDPDDAIELSFDTEVPSYDEINIGRAHGFSTGDPVRLDSGNQIIPHFGGTVADDDLYYAIVVDGQRLALTSSKAEADKALPRIFAPGGWDTVDEYDGAVEFIGDNDGDNQLDSIYLIEHNFEQGDAVVYSAAGDVAIGGLVDGRTYYVVAIDPATSQLADPFNSIQLSETPGGSPIILDPSGTSELHYLRGDVRIDLGSGLLPFTPFDDVADGEIDLGTAHGLATGDPVDYASAGNANDLEGLANGNRYYAIVTGTQTLKLAETVEDAQDATAIELTPLADQGAGHYLRADSGLGFAFRPEDGLQLDTSAATGTAHRLRLSVDPYSATQDTHGVGRPFDASLALSDDGLSIDLGYAHGFATGQKVVYSSGRGSGIGGLDEGKVYYVVVISSTEIGLTDVEGDAFSVEPEFLEMNASDATGANHVIAPALRAQAAVDSAQNVIDLDFHHGFETGDEVVYRAGEGNTAIGGLTSGDSYFVIRVSQTEFQLADTVADAHAGSAKPIDGSLATGNTHTIEDAAETPAVVTADDGVVLIASTDGHAISGAVALSASRANGSSWFTGAGTAKSKNEALGQSANGGAGAGSIATNVIVDRTYSKIESATVTSLANVDGLAEQRTFVLAGTGGLSFSNPGSKRSGGKAVARSNSVGLVGALSINVVAQDTRAAVDGASVVAGGGVTWISESEADLVSLAIGVAGVAGSAAVAGAFGVNVVAVDTIAEVTNQSGISAGGDVTVRANNDNFIGAINAAFSVLRSQTSKGRAITTQGGQVSIGAGIGVNVITTFDSARRGTVAEVKNSDVATSGTIEVLAETTNLVWAIAGGFAIASGSTQGLKLAVAMAVTVNIVAIPTIARIDGKKRNGIAAGDLVLSAEDESEINTIAGVLAWSSNSSQKSAAAGASIAISTIDTEVEAT